MKTKASSVEALSNSFNKTDSILFCSLLRRFSEMYRKDLSEKIKAGIQRKKELKQLTKKTI